MRSGVLVSRPQCAPTNPNARAGSPPPLGLPLDSSWSALQLCIRTGPLSPLSGNLRMEKLCARAKKDVSRERNVREMASRPFDLIRRKKLIETMAEDFLRVLEAGKVSTKLAQG
jgi:hypothetical protein